MEQNISIPIPSVSHQELAAQGRAFLNDEKPAKAQAYYVKALLLDPENKAYKEALMRCLPHVSYPRFNPQAQKAIILCLEDPEMSHRKATKSWLEQAKLDPAMELLIRLLGHESYESFKAEMDFADIHNSLNNYFFCLGLTKCLLMDFEFEALVIYLRRFYLLEASDQEKKLTLPFLCALATKCFSNEYIYQVSSEELAAIDALKTSQDITLGNMLVLGSYIPLYQLDHSRALSKMAHNAVNQYFIDVAIKLIDEPLEEREIAQTIESFTSIDNEVSVNVQAQYEEHPYPRWTYFTPPLLNEKQRQCSLGKDLLVAGCGTGQESALVSLQMPLAEIDAIDLSRISMAYAIRSSRKAGLNNISFKHGDLLKVKDLNKSYDAIFSSGVLHHMEDPVLGLKKLCGVLKPQGVLSLSLYSELGRQDIAQCQQWVKDQGYASTTEAMRKFRKDVMAMADSHPLKSVSFISDFYSASECRDLIFHVQEHRFTCLTLKKIIEDLDLVLLHFGVRIPTMKNKYLERYPDDPKGLNLENWHEFECDNPSAFRLMYDFIVGRKGEHESRVVPAWIADTGMFGKC